MKQQQRLNNLLIFAFTYGCILILNVANAKEYKEYESKYVKVNILYPTDTISKPIRATEFKKVKEVSPLIVRSVRSDNNKYIRVQKSFTKSDASSTKEEFKSVKLTRIVRQANKDYFGNYFMNMYCSHSKCGKNHIACNNHGGFGSQCPSNAQSININPSRDLILQVHNLDRDKVSAGFLSTVGPAIRMSEMVWNDELQLLAQLNANLCVLKPDECHSLDHFPNSGQNIGIVSYNDNLNDQLALEKQIKIIINKWIAGSNVLSPNAVSRFKHSKRDPYILMIAENNSHIGCGAVSFTEKEQQFFRMTCNYATSNIEDNPVYSVGTQSASNCKFGISKKYKHLCQAPPDHFQFY